PQAFEKAGGGRNRALIWLDDDRRELIVVRVDERFGRREVVVRRDQHLAVDGVRDTRGIDHRRRGGFGRARHHAHEHVIVRAVEPALELHDLVALAIRARHAQGEERRLAAARRVAYLLRTRHGRDDLLGEPDGWLVHHEVGRAALHLTVHGLHDRWM